MLNANDSLLLDTNVWLDYCLADRAGHAAALELIARATARSLTLAITAASLKDVSYLLERYAKAALHAQKKELTEADARAIRALVWSYIDLIDEIAIEVPVGVAETWFARHYRSVCSDFEDCLVFGAAKASKAAYLVTEDKEMLLHAPVAAVCVQDALALIG